ncbi:hypothetical protein ACFCXP_18020 [Streptomyces niveus]|uniref:hypothetical protein n=1 Tax=Streptomyces niveus TaxID=193462 RepID=UPI0035E1C413
MSHPRKKKDRSVMRHQLPTVRTRTADQLKVMLAVGLHLGVFTSRQLEVPGVSDHRKGLVIAFLHSCGLLVRGGGRGIYRATPAARRIAEAWARSETLGRRELAIVLDGSWFAEIAREELGEHSGQRVALANRLLAAARAPETRRGEVEILIMWLLEARLLLPVREGYVRWNADAHTPVSSDAAETAATGELKGDVVDPHDDPQGSGHARDAKPQGTSQQVGPETASTSDDQETAADRVVDSVPAPTPRDPSDRPDTNTSLEGHPPSPVPEHPYTTVSQAGIAEDEMLEPGQGPDTQPTSDEGSPLGRDAIPPQAARNADIQSVLPTPQLTELAHLGELVSRSIQLPELLQFSEDELLSMYRGLRRIVDVAAGSRDRRIEL